MHAHGYFLLADDYALVAQAAEHSLSGIFQTGLFGVYRPLGFVVAKLAGGLTRSPVFLSAVILLLHAGNAALLWTLARRLGYPQIAAALASLMFLWSPWGSEAYLWFSGVFDVGATFGILAGALALTLRGGSGLREAWAVIAAVLACLVAAGFKENGYLAAAIVPALALSGLRPASRRRASLVALLAAICAAAVFSYRSGLLAFSGTTYSATEFGGRLMSWAAVPAAASNLRGLLLWPVPAVWGDVSRLLATTLIWPLGGAMTTGAIVLAVAGRNRAWLQLIALGPAIAMTAFYGIAVATITPRRYLYLAGVPLSLLLGSAVAARLARDVPTARAGLSLVFAGLLVPAALAGMSQMQLWGLATTTARCAIDDFESKVLTPATARAYVDNMPFAVDHGPFILLDYDFTYAYRDRWHDTDVVFRHAVLTLDSAGRLTPQGYGEAPADATKRTAVSLDLCLGQSK